MGSGGAAAWVESPLALALAVFASVSGTGVTDAGGMKHVLFRVVVYRTKERRLIFPHAEILP